MGTGVVMLMSYAEKFLNAKGQSCTIKRTPIVSSRVSMKRSTKSSRDLGSREAYWEGLILLDASLSSGEVMTIGSDDYLVQTANFDPASSATAFFAAKSNAMVHHARASEVAVSGNIVTSWPVMNASVTAYVEVTTYKMKQEDPGLLDQTRYIAQVPKLIGADMLDRIIMNGDNLEVVSIDSTSLAGVAKIQLGVDVRPD
jgi:hypothetical protein